MSYDLVERIDSVEDAVKRGENMDYFYMITLSDVKIGSMNKYAGFEPNELIEVRYFNQKEEYRIFRYDGELAATYISDDTAEKKGAFFSDKAQSYGVDNAKFGKTISVKDYIMADEDGQCSIVYSRLCGWEDK